MPFFLSGADASVILLSSLLSLKYSGKRALHGSGEILSSVEYAFFH
jgi:hypothetical protein